VTFSGHSERPVPGEHGGGWCLHDQVLRHAETARLVAAAPASAHIVIIAGTCYAAACAAAFAGVPATTVVLAACAENQTTLNYQQSQFVKALERLTYPGGRPTRTAAAMPGFAGSFARTPPTSSGLTYAPATQRPCASAHSSRRRSDHGHQPMAESTDTRSTRAGPRCSSRSCCSQAGDRDVVNAEAAKAGRAARAGGEGTRRRGP
jgi:hypothetical protein